MKSKLFLLIAALLPAVVASPLPEKADLLASNTVTAQYLGTVKLPCHFRTALCPDRCDHPTNAAQFRVLTSEAYEKPGKYGDAQAAPGNMIMVDVVKDVPGQPDEVMKKLAELKPGQIVRLSQKHYYADLGTLVTPIRPITQLEILKDGACEEIPSMPKDPANHDHEVMPINRMLP